MAFIQTAIAVCRPKEALQLITPLAPALPQKNMRINGQIDSLRFFQLAGAEESACGPSALLMQPVIRPVIAAEIDERDAGNCGHYRSHTSPIG